MIHPSAFVDPPCSIGAGTQIWHFSHVSAHAELGEHCKLGQNVFVASRVVIGNRVKIQNNVSLYEGVRLEDDVFCGPSCVFTNVLNPRSQIVRSSEYQGTLVRRGATLGANCTIVCGGTIGQYAFVGAGAVIRGDVPDYALMLGVPARQRGWMGRHGYRLKPHPERKGFYSCPETQWSYQLTSDGVMRCLDWPEDKPL
jgi:UDP-2-acetamido-3-amino-2,3-dideoxy-glucuronate N-acetyltransferase